MDTEEYTGTISPPAESDEYMLTTVDNPYNPFTDYENWLSFDEEQGYNTCGLLARMALTSSDLTDKENEMIIDHAVEDILTLFPGIYRKVSES